MLTSTASGKLQGYFQVFPLRSLVLPKSLILFVHILLPVGVKCPPFPSSHP